MFEKKYSDSRKRNLDPFSKGVAFALLVLVFKACVTIATNHDLPQQEEWTKRLDMLFLVALTSDLPIMFVTVMLFSKGSPTRMLKMAIGLIGSYALLGWLIVLASKAYTKGLYTETDSFFFF